MITETKTTKNIANKIKCNHHIPLHPKWGTIKFVTLKIVSIPKETHSVNIDIGRPRFSAGNHIAIIVDITIAIIPKADLQVPYPQEKL